MTTAYIEMNSPTTSQLNALAYAPMPFAWLSFLSSIYMIYFLVWKHCQRLHRLYHRLVLSMNIALVPLSLMYAWSTLAVPEGTIGYVGASGNTNTCTAQGFISLVFSLAVPTYYGAFVLQAFMGIKNNFNEAKYVWIEKWIHLVAYLIPSAYAIIIAATNNFNPNGSGCWYAKWPKGCDNSNPDAPQCRGDDIDLIMYIIGFTQIFLYFIFPPVVIASMYCWIRRIRKEAATKSCSGGMLAVRETARREMMQSIYRQITIYLGSFWFIWVPGLISNVYTISLGKWRPAFLVRVTVEKSHLLSKTLTRTKNAGRMPRVLPYYEDKLLVVSEAYRTWANLSAFSTNGKRYQKIFYERLSKTDPHF